MVGIRFSFPISKAKRLVANGMHTEWIISGWSRSICKGISGEKGPLVRRLSVDASGIGH